MLLTARYVLPVSTPHIEYGAVRVVDGVITEVGHAQEMRLKHPDDQVRDFGLAALMPGFINAHSHIEYSVLRGILNDVPYATWKSYITEKKRFLTDADWQVSADLGALELLSSGITTIADMTSRGKSAEAADKFGLRSVIYRKVTALHKDQVDEVMAHALRDIAEWEERFDQSRMCLGISTGSLYTCHPAILKSVGQVGADGTRIGIHLAGSREEYGFIMNGSSSFARSTDNPRTRAIHETQSAALLPTGVSPVRYAVNWGVLDAPHVLAIHCVHVDDSDIEKLAQRNISIAVCPRANAKLSMGLAPIQKFKKAGITVALGTDSPAAADDSDMFEEMRFGLLAQRALNTDGEFLVASDMIRMATVNAAKALGIDDKVGTLDAGKCADIIAVDLSSSHQVPTHFPNSAVVHTADRSNVVMTMINGEILYEKDRYTCDVDVKNQLERVEELRVRLRS